MLTKEQREYFDNLHVKVQCEYDFEQARFDFDDLFKRQGGVYTMNLNNPLGDDPDLKDIVDEKKLACESFNVLSEVASKATDYSFDKQAYDDDFSYVMDDIINGLKWDEGAIEALMPYFVIPVEVYQTRGYGQGDYAYVVLFCEDVTNEERNQIVKQSINNAFWDAPIFCRLVFGDGSDFVTDNVDRYQYDKEEYAQDLLAQVKDEIPDVEAFKEYLFEIMPDEPVS